MIRVTDLKKYYKGGAIKALDGVTVDINKGDVVAVIGPSDPGSPPSEKPEPLEEPTGGSIIFNGIDITRKKYKDENGKTVKLDIDKLRQKMGMVFSISTSFSYDDS